MPKPRKTLSALQASGTFAHNKGRYRSRLHAPAWNGPIGSAPAYMDLAQRKVWRELIDECGPGVLSRADRKHLELTTRLTALVRIDQQRMERGLGLLVTALVAKGFTPEDARGFRDGLLQMVTPTIQHQALLSACLGRMGMSPKDRSRVERVPKRSEQPDPFDGLVVKAAKHVTKKK